MKKRKKERESLAWEGRKQMDSETEKKSLCLVGGVFTPTNYDSRCPFRYESALVSSVSSRETLVRHKRERLALGIANRSSSREGERSLRGSSTEKGWRTGP